MRLSVRGWRTTAIQYLLYACQHGHTYEPVECSYRQSGQPESEKHSCAESDQQVWTGILLLVVRLLHCLLELVRRFATQLISGFDLTRARYALTPLLSLTIKKNLNLTQTQIANSNIAALTGTLLVHFVAGPLCDRFSPRWTCIIILLSASIPTAMAGLVNTWQGLIALRFFVGILGGTFVPCQVWSMGFFDKNVVGSSNALVGGWGNAGGGITYFLMPQIYDSE